jgi:hypothetical protein
MPAKANNPKTEATDEKLDAAFGPLNKPAPPKPPYDHDAYRVGYSDGQVDTKQAYAWAREARHQDDPLIYGKLAAVMAELPAVGKDSKNEQQGWNFRGVDAVVNAISPALRKHGVVVVPSVQRIGYRDAMTTGGTPRPTREVTVEVAYTFYAEDGSSVTAVVPGESLDQSDKGSAKAMSVAFRIALLQVFALPTSEPDPDASYHTRDGAGSMGEATKALLVNEIIDADIPTLSRMWDIVLEHSAAERLIGEATITWADYFAQRIAEIIADIETRADGLARYEELKVARVRGLRFQGVPVTVLMEQRGAFLKDRAEAAFDKHVAAILGADTPEGVGIAYSDATADRMDGVLYQEQLDELKPLAVERKAKLERELMSPTERAIELHQPVQDATTDPDLYDAVTEPSGADGQAEPQPGDPDYEIGDELPVDS